MPFRFAISSRRPTTEKADVAVHVVDTQPMDQLRQLLVIAERGELGELGDWLAPRLNHYLTSASARSID